METAKNLVRRSLDNTNAHGLARLVNEKKLYARVLWLLAWLVCCAVFLRQFVGFSTKLWLNEVTTSFESNAVPFDYPDLYFCFDSPLSGSRHLGLNESAAAAINATFDMAEARLDALCTSGALTRTECNYLYNNELAMMSMNSLSYRFLVDQLGHTRQQSILNASIVRTSGLIYRYQAPNITEFYHPSNLRCFRTILSESEKRELVYAGFSKSLYFQLMLDAPDTRMGQTALPVLETPVGNITAPYWALDKDTLYWPDRWSVARMYVTAPGHYPSRFDTTVSLEAGRSYNVELGMSEKVHKEDPSKCVSQHPDVQLVNPYDNSPYTVAYDYAYCYSSAVQAQLQRELNATLAFLPHPWPPSGRSIYNLSTWGSEQDFKTFLSGTTLLSTEEPLKQCETRRMCTERTYTAAVNSVLWPTPDSLRSFLRDLDFPGEAQLLATPALHYLKRLIDNPNTSELAVEFVRANFLQLQITIEAPNADRTTFARSYSFDSFVADVGGLLGIYLGMSVLTLCELMQFVHDLVLLIRRNGRARGKEETAVASDDGDIEAKEMSK